MTEKEFLDLVRKRIGNVEIKKSKTLENVYYAGKLNTRKLVEAVLRHIR